MEYNAEVSGVVQNGLRMMGSMIDELAQVHGLAAGLDPTCNSGAQLQFPSFAIRAYCWCDGEEHADECPPNFEYPSAGIAIEWYKHLGRGTGANREISSREWAKIQMQCLQEVTQCMSDYEFVRKNLMPDVYIAAFKANGKKISHPVTPPPVFIANWKRDDYLFRAVSDGSAYECYLLSKCPPLQIGPPIVETAVMPPGSLIDTIPVDRFGFHFAASKNPDGPAWGDWIDTEVFTELAERAAIVTRVPVKYQEPDEDTLDYLRLCQERDDNSVK